jgi:hypothetical protein
MRGDPRGGNIKPNRARRFSLAILSWPSQANAYAGLRRDLGQPHAAAIASRGDVVFAQQLSEKCAQQELFCLRVAVCRKSAGAFQ